MLTEASETARYFTDWRGVFTGSALAVARPTSTAEVAAIVSLCAREGIAIVPQGGNTGLAAGATPIVDRSCIVLATERMRTIRNVDSAGYTISVDAGCVLADVQEAAARHNRLFPLSLAAEGSAQIGGLIATNAGGTAVLRYGSMRSLMLGIEAVLADGSIVHGMRALRKDNAGYDWKHLLIGSEGTLGIITGAVLRLFPRPRHSATALIGVSSLEDAIELYATLQESIGEALTACELIPERAMTLPLARHPWYVLVEGNSSLVGLEEAFAGALGERDGVIATSREQARQFWEVRESISEMEKRLGKSAKHDVSVPISAIPAFVAEATAAVGLGVIAFGHLGDGNIHFNVILGNESSETVNAIVHAIVEKYDGSITAEHGIGRYRTSELRAHRSEEEQALMRQIKQALDPHNLMNPGAVLSP